ncbi:hypothetical protein ACQKWADRAFT_322868 [Trichoderma austrokoningii]
MAAFHPETGITPLCLDTEEDQATLLRVLQTPFEHIYTLSPDGMTYLEPPLLRGTPERSWDSFDAFLEREGPEAVQKQKLQTLCRLHPNDGALAKKFKHYSDNTSKFKKIREIFGEGSKYHPNQLIGKRCLPLQGLCQMEPMYKLACKISDLQCLHNQGRLGMDPFDFIRWRVMKKAASMLVKPGDTPRGFLRSIVYKLGDDCNEVNGKAYEDSVMRQAALLSARERHLLNSYGPKKKFIKSVGRQTQLPFRPVIRNIRRQAPRLLSADVRNSAPKASTVQTRRDEAQRAQRARRNAVPSIYTGINDYRARQQAQRRKNEH